MKGLITTVALLATAPNAQAVNVDMTHAGMQVKSTDTIRLRNVQVSGAGYYWVDLKWDAEQMAFRPVTADRDVLPQFSATRQRITFSPDTTYDLDAVCRGEYGVQYSQADWSDISGVIGSDPTELQTFKNTVYWVDGNVYFVKYGNANNDSRGRPYYVEDQSSYAPSTLEALQDIKLTYAGTAVTGQAICVRSSGDNPFATD